MTIHTLRDVLDLLPEEFRGEIIDNTLYVQPGPSPAHEDAIGALIAELRPRYHTGKRGPGGWHIQIRPGISIPSAVKQSLSIDRDSYQPDIAGWHRQTVETLAFDSANETSVRPDWICEVQSTNRAYDWGTKKPAYERMGVPWLWMVDPDKLSFDAFKLENGAYRECARALGYNIVKGVEPFPKYDIDLTDLWPKR